MAAYPGEMRLRYNALLNEAVRDSDRIVVQPGAVHFLGGRPVMVYDAKYKAAADVGASLSGDHYRMLAYCTSLRVPTAWIIYPGAGEIKLRRILNTDIDIVEFPLDLSLPPSEILAAVADLAQQSWGEVLRQASIDQVRQRARRIPAGRPLSANVPGAPFPAGPGCWRRATGVSPARQLLPGWCQPEPHQ